MDMAQIIANRAGIRTYPIEPEGHGGDGNGSLKGGFGNARPTSLMAYNLSTDALDRNEPDLFNSANYLSESP
jgi:hypothetical protein